MYIFLSFCGGRLPSFHILFDQDEEEPKDESFSPDGGYIPRILFLGMELILNASHNIMITYKKLIIVAFD